MSGLELPDRIPPQASRAKRGSVPDRPPPDAPSTTAPVLPPATVLLADDDRLICLTLAERLRQEGCAVEIAYTGAAALARFANGVDVVLLDYRLPDTDGLAVLRQMKQADSEVPVIILTAHSSVELAVHAMNEGALHYAAKPLSLDEVVILVRRALETTRLKREVAALRSAAVNGQPLTGASPKIAEIKALLAKIAVSPGATVLITGESGSGKNLAAKAIHLASARAGHLFLTITCSALPPALLESELFGHERGAFTDAKDRKRGLLETAHGGTVFLDEIGELDPAVQAKVLRFLEDKTFRRVGGNTDLQAEVRVIAATNVDLATAVAAKAFREDLFYRLAVLTVHMPPLRERPEDIEILARFFIERFSREYRKTARELSPAAARALREYAWPGNVRELRNLIERAVLLCEGPILDVADFQVVIAHAAPAAEALLHLPGAGLDLLALERSLLVQALKRSGGNQVKAGALLGLTRDQVRHRVKKHGLSREDPHE